MGWGNFNPLLTNRLMSSAEWPGVSGKPPGQDSVLTSGMDPNTYPHGRSDPGCNEEQPFHDPVLDHLFKGKFTFTQLICSSST